MSSLVVSVALRRILVVLLFLTLSLTSFAQSGENKNFLWRLGNGSSTVYILGSIHFLRDDIYPLSATIENAFNASGSVAVEADIDSNSHACISQIMEKGFYPPNDRLENHVSSETYRIIRQESIRLGLPEELTKRYKPWCLALTFSSLELLKAGYNPERGIDKYFLNKALNQKKKVFEIESLNLQIDLLSSLSDDDQELFLIYTLKDLETLTSEMDKLVSAWRSGNVSMIDAITKKSVEQDKKLKNIFEKLIFQRNRNMVAKIEEYAKMGGPFFVIVGAAHLVGEGGVINILRGKGYKVEQL